MKAECAINELKGVWNTKEKASNFPVKASNVNVELNDVNKTNEFSTASPSGIQDKENIDDSEKFRASLLTFSIILLH